MGQLLYNGKWLVEPNTELDYIINFKMTAADDERRQLQQVSVDEVYLDLDQAERVLKAGPPGPPFSRVVDFGGRHFCPIVDFMARAAKKTAKSSRVFKVTTNPYKKLNIVTTYQ